MVVMGMAVVVGGLGDAQFWGSAVLVGLRGRAAGQGEGVARDGGRIRGWVGQCEVYVWTSPLGRVCVCVWWWSAFKRWCKGRDMGLLEARECSAEAQWCEVWWAAGWAGALQGVRSRGG